MYLLLSVWFNHHAWYKNVWYPTCRPILFITNEFHLYTGLKLCGHSLVKCTFFNVLSMSPKCCRVPFAAPAQIANYSWLCWRPVADSLGHVCTGNRPEVGFLKQNPAFVFANHCNTVCLLNNMFIFDRYPHRLTAMISTKYECDSFCNIYNIFFTKTEFFSMYK